MERNSPMSAKINRLAQQLAIRPGGPYAHITDVRSAMRADHAHLDDVTFSQILGDMMRAGEVRLVVGDLPSQVRERITVGTSEYAFIRNIQES